jgi:hypothetical protein
MPLSSLACGTEIAIMDISLYPDLISAIT